MSRKQNGGRETRKMRQRLSRNGKSGMSIKAAAEAIDDKELQARWGPVEGE